MLFPQNGRGKLISIWALRVLLALAFLAAGGAKLAGAPQMIEIFEKIGYGQGFRIVTGILEVTGAALLLVPRLTFYGAVLLGCIVAAAVLFHLTVLGGNPLAPLVLAILAATLAWFTRPIRVG